MTTDGRVTLSSERDWWLRTLLVLQAPHAVFVHLRDDSDDAAEARQEPVTAIVFLAGIAGVLATTVAGRLLDDPVIDAVTVAVWAVIGGGFYGIASYFGIGVLVLLGASLAGSVGSYRRARHTLAFASVPIALTLLVWPVRLSLYGTDVFRSGGADGDGDVVFDLIVGRRRGLVGRPAGDREPRRARLELAACGRGDGPAGRRTRARVRRVRRARLDRPAWPLSRKAASSSSGIA